MIIGGALLYLAYYNSFYAMDRANALFNRAETAGFAEEMITYMNRGRALLPKSGNPVWWFPTDKTNFTEIQKDIDSIIARAVILEGLSRDTPAYQNGMNDLRVAIKTLELQVSDAAGYLFVSGPNVVTTTIWLAAFAIVAYLIKK